MKIKKNELTILQMVTADEKIIDEFYGKFKGFPVVLINFHINIKETEEGYPVVIPPEESLTEENVSKLIEVLSETFKCIKKRSKAVIDVKLPRGTKKITIPANKPLTILPPVYIIAKSKNKEIVQIQPV